MDSVELAEATAVLCHRFWRDRSGRPILHLEVFVQKELRIGSDHVIRQRLLLDEKEPPHILCGELFTCIAVHSERRYDVQKADLANACRMIEAKPVGDSRPTVMGGDEEFAMAEMPHDLHLILRHRLERVVFVSLAPIGLAGIPVTAKIGQDYRELLCESASDFVPDDMSLWIAMQKKQRRTVAFAEGVDSGTTSLHFFENGAAFTTPLSTPSAARVTTQAIGLGRITEVSSL